MLVDHPEPPPAVDSTYAACVADLAAAAPGAADGAEAADQPEQKERLLEAEMKRREDLKAENDKAYEAALQGWQASSGFNQGQSQPAGVTGVVAGGSVSLQRWCAEMPAELLQAIDELLGGDDSQAAATKIQAIHRGKLQRAEDTSN
jgi:hypothetical protein